MARNIAQRHKWDQCKRSCRRRHQNRGEAFLRATQAGGIAMPAPRGHLRYSNQTNTDGVWFGHGGYGGQYMVANPDTGRVAVFLSVLQDEDGYDSDYYPPIIAMLAALSGSSSPKQR